MTEAGLQPEFAVRRTDFLVGWLCTHAATPSADGCAHHKTARCNRAR
jgi:hypothetical protein